MRRVGVRELRQNLSRYLTDVKQGESLSVTERGREIARLTPSGPRDSALARLVVARGATVPTADLLRLDSPDGRPAGGRPSPEVLDEAREDRL